MGLFNRERRAVEVMERRDPTAATKALRWVTPGRAEAPDWDAQSAFAVAYYMSVVVYACVRLHANTLASLPFRTGADPNKPNDYDVNSPLAKLLGPPPGGPAPKLSARRLWAWTVAQRIVTGRNAWEMELPPGGGAPVALWPLASSSLKPKPSESGIDWFKGFTYGRPGEERDLRNEQVCYDWDPSGIDFRQPESSLQAANLDIAVSVMQSKYDYSFLKNDARPSAIVVTEAFEDEDSYDAFKAQWNSTYGGADNAGRMAFIEATGGDKGVTGAVDVKELGFSPKDAQAAQRHVAAMERCAIALGTPWSLLDASGRTFSNAGQEWTNWCHNRLIPLAHDFADMVNMQLAPLLGNQVGWFDLNRLGIEQMDRVDASGASILFGADLITKNEGRAPFGLPPITDGTGEKFASDLGLPVGGLGSKLDPNAAPAPAGEPGPAPASAEAPHEERKIHDYRGDGGPCVICGKPPKHTAHGYFIPKAMMPANGSTMQMSAQGVVRSGPDSLPGPAPIDHEARRAKLWNTTNGKVRNLERQWERALAKLFARQARSAVARLEGKRGRSLVRDSRAAADEVFDPAHWVTETTDDVTALYEAVTAAGGARVSDLFGLAFDIEAPYAQDFVQARAKQLAGYVTDTTYNAVKDALARGIAEGESIPQLADRLRAVFSEASDSRAKTIARTEVVSAFNGSASLTAVQYGTDVVAGQEWITEMDDRTRPEHEDRDGEIVGIDELFSGGLAYPGDPNGDPEDTINCRCTLGFLTPDEMDSRSGGRTRMVERRVAHAFIRMVQPGPFDERAWRDALKVAA